MSDKKFTKGEWSVYFNKYSDTYSVIPEKGFHTHDSICLCFGNDDKNAHLIAKAPKLYAEIERDIAYLNRQIAKGNEVMEPLWIQERDRKVELLAEARGELE